jgi:hypothetical protein
MANYIVFMAALQLLGFANPSIACSMPLVRNRVVGFSRSFELQEPEGFQFFRGKFMWPPC